MNYIAMIRQNSFKDKSIDNFLEKVSKDLNMQYNNSYLQYNN